MEAMKPVAHPGPPFLLPPALAPLFATRRAPSIHSVDPSEFGDVNAPPSEFTASEQADSLSTFSHPGVLDYITIPDRGPQRITPPKRRGGLAPVAEGLSEDSGPGYEKVREGKEVEFRLSLKNHLLHYRMGRARVEGDTRKSEAQKVMELRNFDEELERAVIETKLRSGYDLDDAQLIREVYDMIHHDYHWLEERRRPPTTINSNSTRTGTRLTGTTAVNSTSQATSQIPLYPKPPEQPPKKETRGLKLAKAAESFFRWFSAIPPDDPRFLSSENLEGEHLAERPSNPTPSKHIPSTMQKASVANSKGKTSLQRASSERERRRSWTGNASRHGQDEEAGLPQSQNQSQASQHEPPDPWAGSSSSTSHSLTSNPAPIPRNNNSIRRSLSAPFRPGASSRLAATTGHRQPDSRSDTTSRTSNSGTDFNNWEGTIVEEDGGSLVLENRRRKKKGRRSGSRERFQAVDGAVRTFQY
ncbi:hypothetical protein BDV96DRAFT_570901 [Lophiotrema nucula]|uniref:Uncharacterized protein n=1 Tax=Lophiotrema nucula TaxID=690887 RepID=A0A6A5ZFR4_9PLEO|nr:hypothetical protein BDV96DRAFT_570901 [Lophiotrema nucula]